MADEINEVQVEKLTLQIDVKGATASQTKKINAFADSLKNLDKALSESLLNRIEKLNKLNLGFGKVTGFSKMAKSMAKTQRAMEQSLHLPSVISTSPKPEIKQIGTGKQNWTKWSSIGSWLTPHKKKKSKDNLDDKQAGNYRPDDNVIDVEAVEGKTIKKYSDLWENLKKVGKVTKALGSTFGKLTKSLKKGAKMIGIVLAYTLAFRALNAVTTAFTEGISNLAIFDKQANKTMSELTTSLQNIKNAIGLIAMPLVEIITPVVKSVSVWLVDIANTISQITASAKGLATYTKISSKYMNDYAKSLQGTSFAFDTFTALQSSVFDMYDMEEVAISTEDANKEINKFKTTLLTIGSLITAIFATDKINKFAVALSGIPFSFSTLSGVFLTISGAVTTIVSLIDIISNGGNLENISNLIAGISVTVAGIGLLIGGVPGLVMGIIGAVGVLASVIVKNWEEISTWFMTYIGNPISEFFTVKVPNFFISIGDYFTEAWSNLPETMKNKIINPIGNFFIGMINKVIGGFETMVNGLLQGINNVLSGLKDVSDYMGWDWNINTVAVSFDRIPMLANGGMVNAGSLFIAGESGAELLTNMGSGTTGVTNVSQFKQAMIEAIYETGLLSTIEESGNIYLDSEKFGKKMGQTKSIRQQLNRTNPNLNLK